MRFVLCLMTIPLVAQQSVNFCNLEKERALADQLASEVRRQSRPVANADIEAYVTRLGSELASRIPEKRFDYHFEVISDATNIEPFALPGGYVFVPVRALAVAKDEAEFVSLVAHAIGHVALRHGTRMATRGEIVNLASVPLIFNGSWTGVHSGSQAHRALVPAAFVKFQRTQELEADRFGVALAARAGFDAGAYQRYIERTQAEDAEFSPLPARELRLAGIQEAISSLPSAPAASASPEFGRVQEAARSIVPAAEEKPAPTLRRHTQP